MKRFLAIGLAVIASALIIGAAVATSRPNWLPALIRTRLMIDAGQGGNPSDDAGLYCKEHGVPEKFCTLCHADLAQSLPLCEEHGNIPEGICTQCHPGAEEKYNIRMCPNGHGLPQEFCSRCGTGRSASAALPDDGWCAAHNKPEANCAECKFDPKSHNAAPARTKACRQPLPTVKFATPDLAERIGIETAVASAEDHAHTLIANAETAYDGNRYADVTPRVSGFLREIRADLGKGLKQGEVIAVVDSAEVSTAKAQYLTAQASFRLSEDTYRRTSALVASNATPRIDEITARASLNQAKAAVLDAEQRLRNFRFDDAALKAILRSEDTEPLLEVASPIDGTVILRHAVLGEAVEPTTKLFAVADTSELWLWVDVYEQDIAKVREGQPVAFTVSGASPVERESALPGRITWVGTEVNPQTRTTRVRAELANPGDRLRANQFGQAEIQVSDSHRVVVVPKAAVQRKGDVDVVFLPQAEEGVYRPQRVVTAPATRGDALEVSWGLAPGQRVVTKGAFLLKTEIMKGAIGAGCCE